jgi:hypothetical protein
MECPLRPSDMMKNYNSCIQPLRSIHGIWLMESSSYMIMNGLSQWTPSTSKCSTCTRRYWSIWHTDQISPHDFQAEARTQGLPIPVGCECETSCSEASKFFEKGIQHLTIQWDACLNARGDSVWVSSMHIT